MIYLIILLFILLPVLLYDFGGAKRGWQFWYFTELIILILLAGLRYRIGGDTLIYMEYFEDYPNIDELFEFDFVNADFNPLWYIFNAITKFIWNDFTFFQITHAIVVNSIFFWFFKKYTKYYFTAILIYFIPYYLLYNTEILREALAVSVFMLSFGFLLKKEYVKYFLGCIIALGFHFSAIITFIIPLFLILPRISLIFTLISFGLLSFLLSIFKIAPLLISFFSPIDQLSGKVDEYVAGGYFESFNINGLLASLLPIFIFMYINNKNDETLNTNNENIEIKSQIQNLLYLYSILGCFTLFVPQMFMRMQNYIVPFYIIFLIEICMPYFKDNQLRKNFPLRNILVKLAIVWFLFFSFKAYTADDSGKYSVNIKFIDRYIPYNSVFNPEENPNR